MTAEKGIWRASGEAASRRTKAGFFAALSPREREVAFAAAEGLSNVEIGRRLHMSVSSVKSHISSALSKLGLSNRVQLAIEAYEAARRRP